MRRNYRCNWNAENNIGTNSDIGEEIFVCFIDWQKAFDRVKWTKLMEILKKSGIDWCERRLMSKLYMDQSVIVWLDQGVTKSVKI
jgi:hypothetical protein